MRKLVWVAMFVVLTAGFASAAVELKPCRIEETRSTQFIKDNMGGFPDSLKITLSLSGPEAATAVSYGELKIEEAVDNTGASLISTKKDPFNKGDKFQEFSNAFSRKNAMEDKRPVADPQIEINLAPAKRDAKKIARLRGAVSITGQGTLKTVELTGLKPGDKKKMDLPANAGVTITTNINKDGNQNELEVEITGSEDAIDSLEVLDASGKKISNGASSWSMGTGPVHRTLNLEKPLDATMKLVAKVSVDRKTIKVPFDLKDINLP